MVLDVNVLPPLECAPQQAAHPSVPAARLACHSCMTCATSQDREGTQLSLVGVGEGWLMHPMQSLKGTIAHSKLDPRVDSCLQALSPANRGRRGWVKALVEHCDHWQSTALIGRAT